MTKGRQKSWKTDKKVKCVIASSPFWKIGRKTTSFSTSKWWLFSLSFPPLLCLKYSTTAVWIASYNFIERDDFEAEQHETEKIFQIEGKAKSQFPNWWLPNCSLFSRPKKGSQFVLILSGRCTPTWPFTTIKSNIERTKCILRSFFRKVASQDEIKIHNFQPFCTKF